METKPLISVIMPVYNGERYLKEAIESIIAQTYQPLEIFIVDDFSTDRTAEIAKSYLPKVQYIFQEKAGAAQARNRAISLAKGEFFAFLDADDVWLFHKLELQMAAFDANPNIDIVTGYVEEFISPELDPELMKHIYCPSHPMPGYIPTGILVKKEAFFQVGFFDPNYQIEFTNWWVRATENNLNIKVLNDVVARRRLHQSNQGIKNKNQQEIVKILKASLDRRRGINKP